MFLVCNLLFFSLVAFNILSLSLIFISLITMYLSVFLLGFILPGKQGSGHPSPALARQLGGQVLSAEETVKPIFKEPCCYSVAQSCPLFVTPRTAAHQASLSFAISRSLLKLMSLESVMPSNHLILCRPLLLLPSIFPSIRVFSNELALHNR